MPCTTRTTPSLWPGRGSPKSLRIEDRPDSDLDWSSFELGDMNLFGDFVVAVPAGRNYFENEVDLRPAGVNLLVADHGGDRTRHRRGPMAVRDSLDPYTRLPPEDATAGFLAVNDKTLHTGEGHVSYWVRVAAGVASDTQITNQALNYFDTNDPGPHADDIAYHRRRSAGLVKYCRCRLRASPRSRSSGAVRTTRADRVSPRTTSTCPPMAAPSSRSCSTRT